MSPDTSAGDFLTQAAPHLEGVDVKVRCITTRGLARFGLILHLGAWIC